MYVPAVKEYKNALMLTHLSFLCWSAKIVSSPLHQKYHSVGRWADLGASTSDVSSETLTRHYICNQNWNIRIAPSDATAARATPSQLRVVLLL